MRDNYLLVLAIFFLFSCNNKELPEESSVPITLNAFEHARNQTQLLLEEVENAKTDHTNEEVIPRSLSGSGTLHLVSPKSWTSGFFPGNLWFLYKSTGEKYWLEQAKLYTKKIEDQKYNAGTHDTGFKIYCSFGNGYRFTGNEAYKEVIIQAAKTLSTRFNPKIGAIRSWDHSTEYWDYPVIIDNMMNLELLFAASRLSGEDSFYEIAVEHANTTLEHHFREDNSSYHVVGFDPETGEVIEKNTHQGYSDESAWARGQAWGLYGFTMAYRETGDKKYLKQAKGIADFILNHPHMPADLVPFWDFDVPHRENQPRDASAAAIIASALYELSTFIDSGEYKQNADRIVESLNINYRSSPGENRGFILEHGTGHKPAGTEIDVPLIYADYYYLEALLRQEQLELGNKLFF